MAMPWSLAKRKAAEYRSGERDVKQLTALFDACFRIQSEAIEAAGRFIPLVVENVRGACPWVGRSRWNYGSFHLWGDVPALMPIARRVAKVPGLNWNGSDKPGYVALAFNTTAEQRLRVDGVKQGGDWFNASQPFISRMCSSKSPASKAASAEIAKIPLPLAQHIAAVWKPAA